MKTILMIGTGGTIASDTTESGLAPELTGADFLNYIPSVSALCQVDSVQVCNIDSTNMTPEHWLDILRSIRENYDRYDGFLIAHGTDTMAYTAAALSYLIQDSPKPIVLTGSQKPIHMDSTDSKTNLLDAFGVASDGRIAGVSVVFGGAVIAGTRARKTYSKSYGAFSSINYPVLGVVQEGRLIPYIRPEIGATPRFYDRLDTKVSLVKLIPGISPQYLNFALRESDAVIVESYGVGGVPSWAFYDLIKKAESDGKIVVVTTQVQNEGSDLAVYHVGHRLKNDLGVLESYDMTLEATVAKLMWCMAQTSEQEEVKMLFYTPVANDILCLPE